MEELLVLGTATVAAENHGAGNERDDRWRDADLWTETPLWTAPAGPEQLLLRDRPERAGGRGFLGYSPENHGHLKAN